MEVWTHQFLSEDVTEEGACTLPVTTWQRVHAENPDARRIFAQLSRGDTILYCPLGAPTYLPEEGGAEKVFVPDQILEGLGAEVGEMVAVDWYTEEAFPEATRIVLRPRDSRFYGTEDVKGELERELTRVGVLQQGHSVALRLDHLNGQMLTFDIVATEPTTIVLAEGEEVAIEFEEAADAVAARVEAEAAAAAAAAARPPTPIPEEPESLVGGLNLPTGPSMPGAGYVLGGEVRRTADGRPWNPWRDGGGQRA